MERRKSGTNDGAGAPEGVDVVGWEDAHAPTLEGEDPPYMDDRYDRFRDSHAGLAQSGGDFPRKGEKS